MLWDITGWPALGQPIFSQPSAVFAMALSPDGKTLAMGDMQGQIALRDIDTLQPLGEAMQGHQNIIASISFSPDGKIMASTSADNTLMLWDTTDWQPLREPQTIKNLLMTIFSPDGKTLAAGDTGRKTYPLGHGKLAAIGRNTSSGWLRHYPHGFQSGWQDPGIRQHRGTDRPVGYGQPAAAERAFIDGRQLC